MNCANHTERTATAFCQNCGKPICEECCRRSEGLVLCEPCWVARQASFQAGQPATPSAGQPSPATGAWAPVAGHAVPGQGMPYGAPAGAGYRATYGQPPAPFASPVVAGFLGFIPGVGAMYNGQFIKALLHVVIFIVLIGATEHFDLAGILIPAWIFYQVFDAAHTASARRDGRPLPDPLGILDLSQRLGPQTMPPNVQAGTPYIPPVPPVPPPSTGYGAVYGTSYGNAPASKDPNPIASDTVPPAAAAPMGSPYTGVPYSGPSYTGAPGQTGGYVPIPPAAYVVPVVPARPGEPVGAIVLIVVGLLFLLSTMHVFDFDWITRGWPVLLLILGGWLLWRRARPDLTMPPMPPAPPRAGAWASDSTSVNTAGNTPGTAIQRSSLSILPQESHPGSQPDFDGPRAGHKEDAE